MSKPRLYLPISASIANKLASGDKDEGLASMSTPELAAALVLLKLPHTLWLVAIALVLQDLILTPRLMPQKLVPYNLFSQPVFQKQLMPE